jgi:hypothetical protein
VETYDRDIVGIHYTEEKKPNEYIYIFVLCFSFNLLYDNIKYY